MSYTGSWSSAVDDVTDPMSVAATRDVPRVLGVVTDDDCTVLGAKHHSAVYGL